MATVSLCVIALNEDCIIEGLFRSVYGVVDEIVLIDTGSTDKTKAIAAKYGAKIYDFKWTGSFSDAKNFGISQCTSDFILSLDADEEISQSGRDILRDIVNGPKKVYNVSIVNILDVGEPVTHSNFRLFPRDKNIFFVNKIHEALSFERFVQASHPKLSIIHYGYLKIHKDRKGTNARNMKMLLESVQTEGKEKPFLRYYLAQQYIVIDDYVNAEKEYIKTLNDLATFKDKNGKEAIEKKIFTPLIYTALAKVYDHQKNDMKMTQLLNLDCHTPDLYNSVAIYFHNKKDYSKAIDGYYKASELKYSNKLPSAMDSDSLTTKPYIGLANCFIELKQIAKGIDYLRLALVYNPKHVGVLIALKNNLTVLGQRKMAVEFAERLLEVSYTDQNRLDLGNLYLATDDVEKGLNVFIKMKNPELLTQLYNQFKSGGDLKNADKMFKALRRQ